MSRTARLLRDALADEVQRTAADEAAALIAGALGPDRLRALADLLDAASFRFLSALWAATDAARDVTPET